MPRKNKISEEKLAEIISLCGPEQIAKKFSTAGRCGNEGLFRFCQYLKQEIYRLDAAMPYIRQWYEKWHKKLVDETGHQLAIEDVEVQAEELWDKVTVSFYRSCPENNRNLKLILAVPYRSGLRAIWRHKSAAS